ncbi:MAG: 2'-5' RNA ligase family protein [Acidobacteriia bacterium]|nr:2'-5' RNA ligase family protein [Terriglobia bacterium]
MGADPIGGPWDGPARLNIFALVIYIPGPLGDFLDELRRDLVPHYNPHAHVSVLPPRPLAVPWQIASEQVRTLTEGWEPFEIALTGLEVFPVTDVIYLELGAGAAELRAMHAAMNTSTLAFQEPFPYHPHITLAQEIPHEAVAATYERARHRWSEFAGARTFRAERAAFVQNAMDNCWVDLVQHSLGAVPAQR